MASAVLHGPRNVSEERSHLVCRSQIPLIVDSKESARVVQLYAMPNCRKQVLNLTIIRSGVTNTVGGNDGQIQRSRNADGGLVPPLLLTLLMALQLDVDIGATEHTNELYHSPATRIFSPARDSQSREIRAGSSLCWCGGHTGGLRRGPKDETAISAPMCARMPLRLALV